MRLPASKFVIPCMALIIFLSPLGFAATTVAPGYEPVMRTVNYADLDLTDTRAVEVLYQRIKSAADKVCEHADWRSYETLLHVRGCMKRAIAQAVRDVNSPGLTSLHMAATNQSMAASNQMDFQG
jgi:UrcA family protein